MQPIAGHSLNRSSCDQQDFNASQKNAAKAEQQQIDIENQSRGGYRCLAEGCNHVEIVANRLFNRHLPEMILNNDVNHIRFRNEHLFAVTNGNSAERRKLYSLMQCYVFKPKGSRIWVLESSVEAKESTLIKRKPSSQSEESRMLEESPSPRLSAQDLKKDTTESEEGTLPPKNGQKNPTPKEKSADLFKKHACPTCHYQTNDLSNYNRHYAKHAKSIIPGFRCLAKGCTRVAQQASNLFRGHLEHEVSIRNAAHVTFLNDYRIAIEDGDSQERRALHSQMKCLIIRDKERKSWVMYKPRTDFRSGDGDESFDSLPEATADQALPPERKSLPAHEESSVLPINDEKDECGTSDKLPDLKGDQEKEETLGMRDDCLKDLPLKKRTDAFVQSRIKKRRTGEAV